MAPVILTLLLRGHDEVVFQNSTNIDKMKLRYSIGDFDRQF